ncbi:hypothetical protein MRB53_038613 [Persea americana]|nr:hypothetical protein MRB53_038613 [Persea americana]
MSREALRKVAENGEDSLEHRKKSFQAIFHRDQRAQLHWIFTGMQKLYDLFPVKRGTLRAARRARSYSQSIGIEIRCITLSTTCSACTRTLWTSLASSDVRGGDMA